MRWQRLRRRLRGEGGYSLIEMLVVLVIMGVVMTSLTTVFVTASNSELDMNNRFRAQQNARLALNVFRRDVHCGSSVTLGPAGSPSGPLAAISVTVVLPSGCRSSGTVTWCTEGSGSRFGLFRGGTISGSSCTGGTRYADYLVQPNVFDYTAPSAGSGLLPKVRIDLPVNVKPSKTVEAYELQDNVVLRNGVRA
ncbi:MAG TPA: type II secretion system protein [Gaiellaceae bacterium]|jgi:prepilin-type N-terminal cleavage/methylation domain-containing protein